MVPERTAWLPGSDGWVRRARPGFTLIELIAVIVVLAVLAGVAVPRYFDMADRAAKSAASAGCGALREAIKGYWNNELVMTGEGRWPATPADAMGSVDALKQLTPWYEDGDIIFNIDRGSVNKWHPSNKTVEAGRRNRWGLIWYNPNNGAARFRVPDQGSASATLAYYNEVNQTAARSLSDTSRR